MITLSTTSSREQGVALVAIDAGDLENLRKWKNANREFFFHKLEITADQQAAWFAGFQGRPEDHMFTVRVAGVKIGCMGIRSIGGTWDVYNVILGDPARAGRGYMSLAFQVMISFARAEKSQPITLKVLKQNPAVGWYLKNGFVTDVEAAEHYEMSHRAPVAAGLYRQD